MYCNLLLVDDLYEDVISGTLDDANDEPVLYMDIAEPSPDDTYDDIPANSNGNRHVTDCSFQLSEFYRVLC